jgi:hypothetical protein
VSELTSGTKRAAELALMRAARAAAEAYAELHHAERYDLGLRHDSLSVALRDLARFFPAEKSTDDPRPSKTFSRPVPGESDPSAGRPVTLSNVTESHAFRGHEGAPCLESLPGGFCDRVESDPVHMVTPRWIPPNRIMSVPRELLGDVQPALGDRLFEHMREAYAERVAEVMQVCPRCSSARWVSVSFNEGATRRRQCVPCGKVYGQRLKDDE